MQRLSKNIIDEHKELKFLAFHDSLTCLLNRNWLYKNYDVVAKKKYVYFIDINDLRKVNEGGHTEGDIHIKKCVKSIKISKRDILIRYAGDEFVVFSDRVNLVETNNLFTVGMCEVEDDVHHSINIADKNMIKSKKKRK